MVHDLEHMRAHTTQIKARQAMVDVLEEGALPATPQKGALRFSQPPPTAKVKRNVQAAEHSLHQLWERRHIGQSAMSPLLGLGGVQPAL
eukprot:scaffold6916_cov21-Tisochrysis_lutea.AAC.1